MFSNFVFLVYITHDIPCSFFYVFLSFWTCKCSFYVMEINLSVKYILNVSSSISSTVYAVFIHITHFLVISLFVDSLVIPKVAEKTTHLDFLDSPHSLHVLTLLSSKLYAYFKSCFLNYRSRKSSHPTYGCWQCNFICFQTRSRCSLRKIGSRTHLSLSCGIYALKGM